MDSGTTRTLSAPTGRCSRPDGGYHSYPPLRLIQFSEEQMLKSEIQPGTDYALRERREIGAPLQRVRIIEHIRKTNGRRSGLSLTLDCSTT